ncbi:alpha-xylosidase [Amphibacillus cookii]|uniref:alpha-xylosidase n=1 Tax=Amphibacillus cookii TaxID=767787 RepID=UPI0019570506|nr:alpha-xylosidase [Amphibacillus cookii]MBM7539816.1 alpha-D-xyloside xylohydrolase [Amphibacillus cookii]
MKFTDGFWLTKQGYQINHPYMVRDFNISREKVTLYAPCQYIAHRGNTLNIASLTIEISSPLADVFQIKAWHHKGAINPNPAFELNKQELALTVDQQDNYLEVKSGETVVRVEYDPFHIYFYDQTKQLTEVNLKGLAWIKGPNQSTYMRGQLNLAVGEQIYGLGERFSPFIKNGQVVDIWNQDGGTSSEQAYKNVPFFLSNQGYGVLVNHPDKVSFEVGIEAVSKTQFSLEGEVLDYFVINGKDLQDVYRNYTSLTGKPALPPAWSYGLWLTTSFTTNYDEETVNHFVDGMAERDIPLRVFHFDCFWMKEFEWSNFEWDHDLFPEPEKMLQRLKKKGLQISVWINPYIAEKSKLFDEAAENDFLLKRADGSIWQWDLWQAGMGIVDFSNPKACAWYQQKLKALLDMGVDTFKTDFGERIPTDVVYYDGSDSNKMHNYYSYLYNKLVFDLLKAERGENEAVLFARAATAGGQQFPVHWGGDCDATYESMAESLRGGLSLALSGFGYWSHDIGGFENTSTPDLFKRWTAFGLLSTHSRLHGSTSYRVPWVFDQEAVDVTRYFAKLKNTLMPYLFGQSVDNHQTGLPVMRPLLLDFSEDLTTHYLDRQYMLGSSLLVAPIFNSDGKASYYLPEGKWTHLLTGEVVRGGGWHHDQYDYFNLPLYVREHTILITGYRDDVPDYDYTYQPTFTLYQLQEGKPAHAWLVDQKGDEKGHVTACLDHQVIYIETDMEALHYQIVCHDQNIQSCTRGELKQNQAGQSVISLYGSQKLELNL